MPNLPRDGFMTFFMTCRRLATLFASSSVILVTLTSFLGCVDESFTEDPADQPVFSTDTLAFDTVLTAVSTVTRLIKVYNPHDDFLRIDEVVLTGVRPEFFRINVDGRMGPSVRNVDIPALDSLYVFVEATIDPDQPESVSPFVIEARVTFRTKGTEQHVLLVAFGQNANYLPGPGQANRISLLTCDLDTVTWNDPKPYVLYGTLLIDSCTLVLPAGARLYVHGGIARNPIGIYPDGLIYTLPQGRLLAEGTLERPVMIRDDRIEPDYSGTWAGLRFGPGSGPHHLRYTQISQGLIGVFADSAASVRLDGCRIFNSGGPGFLARHAQATLVNSLFYGNKSQDIALTYGGTYSIDYCTLANFGNSASSLLMSNSYCIDPPLCSDGLRLYPLEATIRNSILVGSSSDECWITDGSAEDPAMLRLVMQNNLVVVDELLNPNAYPDFFSTICQPCFSWALWDPLFLNNAMDDYHLDSLSVAIGKGMPLPGILQDLDGHIRDGVMPDLGCYEFQD